MIVEYIFWISLGLVVYSYFLYPLGLAGYILIRPKKQPALQSDELPTVSMVISAYNEQQVIGEKLKNCDALDYPKNKIEFFVGSDGSTDQTNSILRESNLPNLRYNIFPTRRGKAAVLNELVPLAKGEIVVFSDANTLYEPTALRHLVSHFNDSSVGAVCGNLLLRPVDSAFNASAEYTYWNYENVIKRLESEIHSTVGATGAIYAIRKNLFAPLPTNKAVMDDFLIPLSIVKQGFTVKYDDKARAFEPSAQSIVDEFQRKVRIGAANFHGISEFSELLHPRYGFIALALWSHKIIRWCIPFLLIALFLSTALLAAESAFYKTLLYVEVALLALSIVGFVVDKIGLRIGVLGLPYYFIAMNAALFVGFFKFLMKSQKPTWDVIR